MANFCNTLESILKNCDPNTGGVTKIWLNNGHIYDGAPTFDADQLVTGATFVTGATSWVEFQFNPNTSSFAESATVDLTNNTTFYTQTITLVLARREAVKRKALLQIANGQPTLTAIVKDSNGLYWLFGSLDDKLYMTGNEGGSGTAKADANGYTITLTCEDAKPAFEVDSAVALSWIGA